MLTFVAFAVVCCVAGFLAAKAFEWRQDVRHGPYIKVDKRRRCTMRW